MTIVEIIARLGEINKRTEAIVAETRTEGITTARLSELNLEMDKLVAERAELTKKSIELRGTAQPISNPVSEPADEKNNRSEQNPYATIEYRRAFMEFVMHRRFTPALQVRDENGFVQSDASAVIIPTTITDLLFAKRGQEGSIFARVHKSNYPAGISVPKINFRPKLEWVAENKVADKKKGDTATVTFNGYKAQIRVAVSLETQIKTLEQFEAVILDAILIGVDEGMDEAIVVGSGTGKPTGILTGADYTKKAITMNSKEVSDYAAWLKAWAKITSRGRRNCRLHINRSDWETRILGMKDNNGRVIALDAIGIDGELIYKFMGREVVVLEDQGLKTFDSVEGNATASKETAFAYYFDDSKYYLNSNMQLVLRNYIDEDTDEKVHKATLIADGKVVDDDSLLVICRGVDNEETTSNEDNEETTSNEDKENKD